ncbi:MAG: MBL fold metallo-hydrolase, partial [candidate division KSB1 bacterium]
SMSGYALLTPESFLLLDCGDGVIRRGLEAGLPMLRVDAILFSHLHLDHIADLPPLLWALHGEGQQRADRPLHIYGPPGFRNFFEGMIDFYGDWIRRIPCAIIVREVLRERFSIGVWQIQTYSMEHGLPANGYRLETQNKVIAYTGDTGPCDEVIALAREADLFIAECSFPNGQESATHLTAGEVGRIAAQAQCKRVLLTHLYPETLQADVVSQVREYFSGEIELSHDLMRLIL